MIESNYLLLTSSIVIEDAIRRFQAGQGPPPMNFHCSRGDAEPERSNPDTTLTSILRKLSSVRPNIHILPPTVKAHERQGEGFASQDIHLKDSRNLIIDLAGNHRVTIITINTTTRLARRSSTHLRTIFEILLVSQRYL